MKSASGLLFALSCLLLAWWVALGLAVRSAAGPLPSQDDALFAGPGLCHVQLELSASALDSLRSAPRDYVPATLRAGTTLLHEVGVRLKGSTGSFRPLDDKPALTVDCDRFKPGQRFHSLSKFHLNNSVEDPTYLNEQLGSELFRAAGVPAPQVTHALVELNGRRLGLYVLKEGFAPEFLARHFTQTDGNLYEAQAAAGCDLDEPMKRNSGGGVADRSELRRVADAAHEPDAAKRWARLSQPLALDQFLSFMAMEVLSGHRDGYCLARNNYRIYHDPTRDQLVFLPDGMDQLLGRPDAPVRPQMAGLVARAVMGTPAGRQAFQERLATLLTNCFVPERLTNRVRQLVTALGPELTWSEARALKREAAALCERIGRRAAEVERQLAQPEPASLGFQNGVAQLDVWRPVDPPRGGKLEHLSESQGHALSILAGPRTAASWRTRVRLSSGSYRFEAMARGREVRALGYGKNHGIFLGVTGREVSGRQWLTGTFDWTPLSVEFQVAEPEAEVELVCALRASAGEARFKVGSLELVRLEPQQK